MSAQGYQTLPASKFARLNIGEQTARGRSRRTQQDTAIAPEPVATATPAAQPRVESARTLRARASGAPLIASSATARAAPPPVVASEPEKVGLAASAAVAAPPTLQTAPSIAAEPPIATPVVATPKLVDVNTIAASARPNTGDAVHILPEQYRLFNDQDAKSYQNRIRPLTAPPLPERTIDLNRAAIRLSIYNEESLMRQDWYAFFLEVVGLLPGRSESQFIRTQTPGRSGQDEPFVASNILGRQYGTEALVTPLRPAPPDDGLPQQSVLFPQGSTRSEQELIQSLDQGGQFDDDSAPPPPPPSVSAPQSVPASQQRPLRSFADDMRSSDDASEFASFGDTSRRSVGTIANPSRSGVPSAANSERQSGPDRSFGGVESAPPRQPQQPRQQQQQPPPPPRFSAPPVVVRQQVDPSQQTKAVSDIIRLSWERARTVTSGARLADLQRRIDELHSEDMLMNQQMAERKADALREEIRRQIASAGGDPAAEIAAADRRSVRRALADNVSWLSDPLRAIGYVILSPIYMSALSKAHADIAYFCRDTSLGGVPREAFMRRRKTRTLPDGRPDVAWMTVRTMFATLVADTYTLRRMQTGGGVRYAGDMPALTRSINAQLSQFRHTVGYNSSPGFETFYFVSPRNDERRQPVYARATELRYEPYESVLGPQYAGGGNAPSLVAPARQRITLQMLAQS